MNFSFTEIPGEDPDEGKNKTDQLFVHSLNTLFINGRHFYSEINKVISEINSWKLYEEGQEEDKNINVNDLILKSEYEEIESLINSNIKEINSNSSFFQIVESNSHKLEIEKLNPILARIPDNLLEQIHSKSGKSNLLSFTEFYLDSFKNAKEKNYIFSPYEIIKKLDFFEKPNFQSKKYIYEFDSLIFQLAFYHPVNGLKMQEILCYGKTTLNELKCLTTCNLGNISKEKSLLFFIECVLHETYQDKSLGYDLMKSRQNGLLKYCGKKKINYNFNFSSKYSSKTFKHKEGLYDDNPIKNLLEKSNIYSDYQLNLNLNVALEDLHLRIGYPYVFRHGGCCDHIFVIQDIRSPYFLDYELKEKFPIEIFRGKIEKKICAVCKFKFARLIIKEKKGTKDYSIIFMCNLCFEEIYNSNILDECKENVDVFQYEYS